MMLTPQGEDADSVLGEVGQQLMLDRSAVAELHHEHFSLRAEVAIVVQLAPGKLQIRVLLFVEECQSFASGEVVFPVRKQDGSLVEHEDAWALSESLSECALEEAVAAGQELALLRICLHFIINSGSIEFS
jgi:hypothetical protein